MMTQMVYCPKCGKQNVDDATYCNSCGTSLVTGKKGFDKEMEDRCGDECSGKNRTGLLFWGVIVALIGLYVIFEFGLKNISGLPTWIYNTQFGWIFAVVIGAAILVAGLSIIMKGTRR